MFVICICVVYVECICVVCECMWDIYTYIMCLAHVSVCNICMQYMWGAVYVYVVFICGRLCISPYIRICMKCVVYVHVIYNVCRIYM